MNQKSKIAIGVITLFACVSIGVFAADAATSVLSAPKDSQVNASGLAKNEELVKAISANANAPQATAPKVGDLPIAKPQGPLPPPAPQALTQMQPWAGPSFADLEKLRSENAMLAEQLKNAELKKKIGEQGGLANSSDANRPSGSIGAKAPSGPRVVMIAGGEGNYRANIALPSGQSITASVGTNVPGMGLVSAITADAVQFGSGKARRSLSLVTSGANADFVMN